MLGPKGDSQRTVSLLLENPWGRTQKKLTFDRRVARASLKTCCLRLSTLLLSSVALFPTYFRWRERLLSVYWQRTDHDAMLSALASRTPRPYGHPLLRTKVASQTEATKKYMEANPAITDSRYHGDISSDPTLTLILFISLQWKTWSLGNVCQFLYHFDISRP